ncbi:STAS domain-containing protein [uncultured Gimesia sp.]|jgi:anti-sigma B factor antagonist|uniref:STAS domain-containing protein n=1 Tax=uncultured Gimesia sp. TaxID=1678688 RepID=UPI0026084B3E|nr:STAS domain-containing protein [uncultured Gimesia sp.]
MIDNLEIFKVEVTTPNLVVVPQGSTLQFQYSNVQIESNKVLRLFDTPELKNVVIDLSQVDYLDSIIIGAIIRLLQRARQTGGQAVFCNASVNMQNILKCIKVGTLWPLYDSREEALTALSA